MSTNEENGWTQYPQVNTELITPILAYMSIFGVVYSCIIYIVFHSIM